MSLLDKPSVAKLDLESEDPTGSGAIDVPLPGGRSVSLQLPRDLEREDLFEIAYALNTIGLQKNAEITLSSGRIAKFLSPGELSDEELHFVERELVQGLDVFKSLFDAIEHAKHCNIHPQTKKGDPS